MLWSEKRLKQIAHVWWFTVALEVSPQKHLFSPTSGNYLLIYHLSKEVYPPLIYTETVNGFESALWLASQTTNILCHLPKSNKRGICARKYFYCCRNKWVKTILVCYTIFGLHWNEYLSRSGEVNIHCLNFGKWLLITFKIHLVWFFCYLFQAFFREGVELYQTVTLLKRTLFHKLSFTFSTMPWLSFSVKKSLIQVLSPIL